MKMASVEQIVADACREAGVSVTAMREGGKMAPVVQARAAACRALRTQRGMSYPEIAAAVGYRSHVSAMAWCRGGSDGRGSDEATKRRSDEGRER